MTGRGDGVGSLALALSPREDIVARHLEVAQGQLHSPVAERALIELVDARAVGQSNRRQSLLSSKQLN